MKIGTDGILLGAWVNCKQKNNGIDIGTGTGVIAIMMCQQNPNIKIDAIEISINASKDAILNFKNCVWNHNLKLFTAPLKKFKPPKEYDIIVSNPPFFKSNYLPTNKEKSLAKHEDGLTYRDVILFATKNLSNTGTVNLVIPFDSYENCRTIATNNNLFLNRECIVYPKANKPANRVLLEFGKTQTIVKEEKLIIENEKRHDYTTDYKKLTRDFYTIFN